MAEWISVKDRVPAKGQKIIMYINTPRYHGTHPVQVGYFWPDEKPYGNNYWETEGLFDGSGDIVSHWMPFPEPPMEE